MTSRVQVIVEEMRNGPQHTYEGYEVTELADRLAAAHRQDMEEALAPPTDVEYIGAELSVAERTGPRFLADNIFYQRRSRLLKEG